MKQQVFAPVRDAAGTAKLAGALFASALQRCDQPDARQVLQAIAAAIREYGSLGCAAQVAQAYGEHPETAVRRMRWALATVTDALGGSQPEPTRACVPGLYVVPVNFRAAQLPQHKITRRSTPAHAGR
jgi:hypothetical protein